MMFKHIYFSISFIAVLCLTLSCTQANSEKDADIQESISSQDLYSQIQEAMSIEGCTSDTDCALLPVGNKPCGGPEAYLPYSKTNSDVATLEKLSQQYNEQRKQYNQENQMMGTCVMTPKPDVSCVRNQCLVSSNQTIHIQ